MKKIRSGAFVIASLIVMCALGSLMGCEGTEGPSGPAGEDGANGTAACGTCHNVSTDVLAKQIQWGQSGHAQGTAYYRATSASCAPCHSSEGFRMKVAGMEVTGIDNPTPQNCRTCHKIHTNYDASDYARVTTAAVTLTGDLADNAVIDIGEGNLCANCHQTRANNFGLAVGGTGEITVSSTHWGPHHGTQANLLTGHGGFEVPGSLSYQNGMHTTLVKDGCPQCHMQEPGTTTGGHTFKPNLTGCLECHDGIKSFDVDGTQTEIDELFDELSAKLVEKGLLAGEEGAYHPVSGKTVPMIQAGALFNWATITDDGSHGVHNPKYIKALLQNSIEALQ